MTTHVFLSPHFDDAVYSCGGTIHQLTQRGDTVLIITVMGGDPPDPLPDTPIVRDLHQRWGAGHDPIATRRAEDRAAAAILGAGVVHLPIPDCVYRIFCGAPLYPNEKALWRNVHPSDPTLVTIRRPLASYITADATVYAPLAVGGHVDHLIVRDWALDQPFSVTFYEDYPYSEQPGAVEAALTELPSARDRRIATVLLTEADIAAKIEAAKAYRSQISTFWQDAAALQQRVRAALMQHGPPQERFYRLAAST